MELYKLILEILNEIESKENNLKVAGGKGYSAGKAYPDKTVSVLQNLGIEEHDNPEDYKLKPVKVSKVFSKRKK
jgi:hypothetical protein